MQVNQDHHHREHHCCWPGTLPSKCCTNNSNKTSDKRRESLALTNNLHLISWNNFNLIIGLLLILQQYLLPAASGFNNSSHQLNQNNNQNEAYAEALLAGGEKPRLIPLVLAELGYSENSSVNVLCTVSQGHHESLSFDWFKDGQLLFGSNEASSSGSLLAAAAAAANNRIVDDFNNRDSIQLAAPQIEKHSDHSLLRIARVQSHHSGRYTCSAKNQFGQDSSSVNLIVNGNYIYIYITGFLYFL